MDPKQHPTLCIMPWASLSIGSMGEILRCQMSREPMGHLSREPLKDIVNNEKFQALRTNMRKGNWDPERSWSEPGCTPCSLREQQGVSSKRKYWHSVDMIDDLWKESLFEKNVIHDIYHLDLAFNNICNFKCRMCNSAFSTRWERDEKELEARNYPVTKRKERLPQALHEYNVVAELKSIMPNLKKLRKLEIVGGEPFFIPEFFEFISELKSQDIWKNVHFMVTTNGSLLKEEYLEAISGCASIILNISVDATGRLFEYTRSAGACTWQTLESNVQRAVEFARLKNLDAGNSNWKINLNGAYQTYNMLNIYDFMTWVFDSLGFHQNSPPHYGGGRHTFEHRLLMFPKNLSARFAPQELKDASLEQIERLLRDFPFVKDIYELRYLTDIIKHLKSPVDPVEQSKRWIEFQDYTHHLDAVRSESIVQVAPWLEPYIESPAVPPCVT